MEIPFLNILFLILAGGFNGIMDTLYFRYDKSVFKFLDGEFWDPSISHANKWKYLRKKGSKRELVKVEKFWGSSRWFVFVTDGWHLSQFFMIKCLILATLDYSNLNVYQLLLVPGWYIGFWIIYETKLLRNEGR